MLEPRGKHLERAADAAELLLPGNEEVGLDGRRVDDLGSLAVVVETADGRTTGEDGFGECLGLEPRASPKLGVRGCATELAVERRLGPVDAPLALPHAPRQGIGRTELIEHRAAEAGRADAVELVEVRVRVSGVELDQRDEGRAYQIVHAEVSRHADAFRDRPSQPPDLRHEPHGESARERAIARVPSHRLGALDQAADLRHRRAREVRPFESDAKTCVEPLATDDGPVEVERSIARRHRHEHANAGRNLER